MSDLGIKICGITTPQDALAARPLGSGQPGLVQAQVDDLDAEIERLVGLGAVLKQPPGDVSDKPRTAFIAGPDDTRIEVMQVA